MPIMIYTGLMYLISEGSSFAGPLLLREIVTGLYCREAAVDDDQLEQCDSKNTLYLCVLGMAGT